MFRSSFLSPDWALRACPGSVSSLRGTWYPVQIDVNIHDRFGGSHDVVQHALSTPGSVTFDEFSRFLIIIR